MCCSPVSRSGRRSKPGGSSLRNEAGCAKPRWPSLASLPSFCTECGSKVPNSNGHQRRLLISLHSECSPTSGRDVPAGTLALVRSPLALRCSKEQSALHTLILQRHLTPSCGGHAPTAERTMNPARICLESLDRRPGIREQPGSQAVIGYGRPNVSEGSKAPLQPDLDEVRSTSNGGREEFLDKPTRRARIGHRREDTTAVGQQSVRSGLR